MANSTGESAPTSQNREVTRSASPPLPPFHHVEAFPDAGSIFSADLAPLKAVKDRALVVLDTNVLVLPYTINSKSLHTVRRTYERLKRENRLFIPAQVAREFAVQRANKLGEMFATLSRTRNSLRVPEVGDYPLLANLDEYVQLEELEQEIRSKLNEYNKTLGVIIDRIRAWRWDDPVSVMYREILTPDIVIE